MIFARNIHKSTKRLGKYEEKIIKTLTEYFSVRGYEVIPHSSLNIAWGSVLSDIDLMLLKNQLLTYVEVKSSRDNLARAEQQIDRIMDYIDYAYVATDKHAPRFEISKVGLIKVEEQTVTILKKAKKFTTKPRFYSVATLKKKCLSRFFGTDDRHMIPVRKYRLAQHVCTRNDCKLTRDVLQEIVTCGGLCSTNCPIEGKQKESFLEVPDAC